MGMTHLKKLKVCHTCSIMEILVERNGNYGLREGNIEHYCIKFQSQSK